MKTGIILFFFLPAIFFCTGNAFSQEAVVTIDGSQKFQQIDGIGVNANTRSWNGNELKPAINLLLDSMHASIWRVVVETVEKWEDENDNNDPFNFNWEYYNKLYKTPKFMKAWNMIRYLNNRGITDNLMINFMGPVPAWMGKKTIKPEFEDEYVEMIASFFYYAKYTMHLKIGLISPTNESDWRNEGPEINEFQYRSVMRKLIDRMESLGMGSIRYVGPDPAGMENGIKRYIPEMMKDPVIMKKLAHVGLHSYGGYYANADSAMKNSAYPLTDFWITEWNAWRDSLDEGKIGAYNYTFASQCVGYLLEIMDHGGSGFMEWEGYDSYYEHHAPSLFSYWGILGYDPDTKTYTARKHFNAIRQITEYVKPGSYRISVKENNDSLVVLAFYDSATKSVSIVGMNKAHQPVNLRASLKNLNGIQSLQMTHTDTIVNMMNDGTVPVKGNSLNVTLAANSIFAMSGGPQNKIKPRPEPKGWYAGDIHVHRNCGEGSVLLPEDTLISLMEEHNLDVISLLADMGNGEVKESTEDLKKVNGKDAPQSTSNRIIHWDTEWHWDATYSNFGHMALGGHLVLLGLKDAHQIWDESPYKVLEWAGKQDAVKGFAHMEYLNGKVQDELNCCIPIDYPVEAALHNIDFISEDVFGTGSPNNGNYYSEGAIDAYYKLLNCGIRLGLAAGTDYPCNDLEPFGKLLTYVKVNDKLTYNKWINGIKEGKTVVSRNGHNEFLDFKVNGKYEPGAEIKIRQKTSLAVEIKWESLTELQGTIELVQNGKVIAAQKGTAKPGKPLILKTSKDISGSGWLCARRMDDTGEHIVHTAPVYINSNDRPVRASKEDAEYFVSWIDNILKNISEGGKWSSFFTHDAEIVQQRYKKARDMYQQIANEAAVSEK